jgi:hypothetical protein
MRPSLNSVADRVVQTLVFSLFVLSACGGGGVGGTTGGSSSVSLLPGTPTVTSLSPNPVAPGGPDFVLSVYGANLSATESVVRLNGQDRPTGLQCTGIECLSQLAHIDATISSLDIRAAGTAQISVYNRGGATSNAVVLRIENVPPSTCSVCITELVPDKIIAGGPGFTLTVNGSGFFPGMVVLWDDLTNPTLSFQRPTTYVSSTQLTATIPASDIRTPGSVYVSVTDITFPLYSGNFLFTVQ